MQHIIQHLFQEDSLEEVPRRRLEELVEEYPSFSMARYLLSRKLQAENADHFNAETQKTNLYFTNPLWLQWLLQDTRADVVEPSSTIEATLPMDAVSSIEEPPAADWSAATASSPLEEAMPLAEAMPPAESPEPATEQEHVSSPVNDAWLVDEQPASSSHSETPPTLLQEDQGADSAADLLLRSIAEAQHLRQSFQELADGQAAVLADIHTSPETREDASPAIAEKPQEPIRDEEAAFILEEQPTGQPAEHPAEFHPVHQPEGPEQATIPEQTTEPGQAAVTEPTPEPAFAAQQPAEQPQEIPALPPSIVSQTILQAQPEPVVFESYHTIDYFASQGIRLTLDENPSDRLGKQVKSFTEWLKVMRKLPQKDRQLTPDIVAEHAIQTIAAHSIEGKEIVTETMAEVLTKQGMPEKASEVYHKLSLLNPDKSAYFAAKIEQLKNS